MSKSRFATIVMALVVLAVGFEAMAEDTVITIDEKGRDTYVDSRDPGNANQAGGQVFVHAGHADGSNNFKLWAMIQFDLSNTPANVESAKLELYRYSGDGTGTDVAVHQIKKEWDEKSASWSALPDFEGTPVTKVKVSDEKDVWHSFDITPLYKAWKSGKTTNYGVMLRTGENNGETFGYYSKESETKALRPRLVLKVSAASQPATQPKATAESNVQAK
ncbi:MAG TPA: DNRLRE domain-containing protein [Phycisphaerae bacterium]|nr:DNRLRE domain-containing protein [Phycisphaerae bacterium]